MHLIDQSLLQLLQLADSALPIGATAHSFGLETLAAEGTLNVEQLADYLRDYLHEAGTLESVFCRSAYRLASSLDLTHFETQWLALNAHVSARKTARESRVANATLGRRFLQLVQNLQDHPLLAHAQHTARTANIEMHYSACFGLAAGVLEIDETSTVQAYLQQSLLGLVSACQRLMPLGQSQASQIVWQLKPTIVEIAHKSEQLPYNDIALFTPLLDLASMRHPTLATRLFIS